MSQSSTNGPLNIWPRVFSLNFRVKELLDSINDWVDGTQDDGTLHNPAVIASWPLREPLIKVYYLSNFQVRDRRLKNLSGRGTREVQKIFEKGKLNETNSCTQSNPKKIHTRKGNVKEKNSCRRKIPHSPQYFSNGPSLRVRFKCYFSMKIITFVIQVFLKFSLVCLNLP